MAKSKPITAQQLMERLGADPEWVARRDVHEAASEAQAARWRLAEAPLAAELAAAGFAVESAWEFAEWTEPYDAAVPILLRHLDRSYPARVRSGIAYALNLPSARSAWPQIVSRYRDEPDGEVKDALAATISTLANPEFLPELIALIMDSANGPSRVLFVRNLARSRKPEAKNALAQLAGDPDLALEIEAVNRGRDRSR